MSDSDTSAFGKFVPGYDFLQNLAKGASSNIPQMPNLGNWVAPTLNVEELDKRIEELKGVHFWLEQNSRALGATIQALEVQKMTLNTLKGMNFNIGDVANALKLKAADSVYSGVQRVSERAASTAKTIADVATGGNKSSKAGKAAAGVAGMIDPMQLWGSLTQQFQQIAAGAVKEATAKSAVDMTKHMATGMAKEAMKSGRKAVGAATTRRAPVKKTAAKSTRKPASRS
jgi:hypothetical protein